MGGADALTPTLQRRRRPLLLASLLMILALLGSSCSVTTETGAGSAESASRAAAGPSGVSDSSVLAATGAQPTPTAKASPDPTPDEPVLDLSEATALPRAPIGLGALTVAPRPTPVSLTIEDLDIGEATVISVAVNEDLSLEVPPADQVGWYEFGPVPGDEGSAVLAAHIAFDGVDGVFRYLEDVRVGAVVAVGFDDGSVRRFRITEVEEYLKEELPDSLFAVDGPAQLALITCGGAFNPALRSYESNTVAIAVPI